MIVGRGGFEAVLGQLATYTELALDCETTGLRPYHDSRLFSIILAGSKSGTEEEVEAYYFNFLPYANIDPNLVLTPIQLNALNKLFKDPSKTWYLHNAKFDLAFLAKEGLFLSGTIHCTMAQARIVQNDHMSYSLDACAKRINLTKDDAVEKYITENKLWDWESVPGKKARRKNYYFDRVPFEIIAPYGEQDAAVTYRLGHSQKKAIQGIDHEKPKNLPNMAYLVGNERKLTKALADMERVGIKVDKDYCTRAAEYEASRAKKAEELFKQTTGRDFCASPKLFQEIFASEKDKWTYTEKNNPSFDTDVIRKFDNPAANLILEYRDAKSKSDFYHGFLYHADAESIIHPHLNQGGTATGRLSSSDPNFQNITSEDGEESKEFLVRRALIPRPGYVFFSPDYSQAEYRLMLDMACVIMGRKTTLVQLIETGLDVHEATAKAVNDLGFHITRSQAKNGNFATLYGAGIQRLADTLKCSYEAAAEIRGAIFSAAPEIKNLIQLVTQTALIRGHIFNWAGRKLNFKDDNFVYRATNALIQGGCADITKLAMVEIGGYLADKKSRMILSIHDEIVIEVWEDELDTVPKQITHIMENVYPAQYLPQVTTSSFSRKSLGDLEDKL